MKFLVVGSGGREHAIAWKLRESPRVTEIFCAPGNPGTALVGENVDIPADDLEGLLSFALERGIDLTVVGPEAPLVNGLADRFEEAGLALMGPSAGAARLEGSKAFAKSFMKRRGIPTAAFQVFDSAEQAIEAVNRGRVDFPVVVKADGLAAGKGVFICRRPDEGLQAIDAIMRERRFGSAGDRMVIEECLEGPEASFMVFSDGTSVVPMPPSRDHKALLEGDRGPNTGGMGAYCADSILSEELQDEVMKEIILPTVRGIAEEGSPYRGILYAGLMLTTRGPKVLEFNVRLGDPEAQAVLPRMEADLAEVLLAVARGSLRDIRLSWRPEATVCVVVASGGYPDAYQKGLEITGLDLAGEDKETLVFHAGTSLQEGKLVTGGGRVLGVTSRAPTLEGAVIRAYEAVNKIYFPGMYYRRDIAVRGLRA